jgi:hypothetical protein
MALFKAAAQTHITLSPFANCNISLLHSRVRLTNDFLAHHHHHQPREMSYIGMSLFLGENTCFQFIYFPFDSARTLSQRDFA